MQDPVTESAVEATTPQAIALGLYGGIELHDVEETCARRRSAGLTQMYEDGSLNGVLAEARAVVMGLTPVYSHIADAGGRKGLYFLAGVANRVGVTTVADLAFGALNWDAELEDHQDATRDPV